jgi:hypothetical protein
MHKESARAAPMKNTSNIFAFVTLIHLLTCVPFLLQAQKSKEEYDQKVADKLATMDLAGVKNGFLLNKGVFDDDEIAYFRNKPRNKQGQVVMNTTAEEWQNLYERLSDADLRTNGRIPDFDKIYH